MRDTPVGTARLWVVAGRRRTPWPGKVGWIVAAALLTAAMALLVPGLRDALRDPVLAKLLTAPPDREGLSEGERQAVEQAREDFRQGRGIPLDQI